MKPVKLEFHHGMGRFRDCDSPNGMPWHPKKEVAMAVEQFCRKTKWPRDTPPMIRFFSDPGKCKIAEALAICGARGTLSYT